MTLPLGLLYRCVYFSLASMRLKHKAKVMLTTLLCVYLTCLQFCTTAESNDRPIIGILAQDVFKATPNQTSYLAASYVKYLESAGARVVPIMINKPVKEYEELFNSINGVLFPGGSASIFSSGYQRAAKIFYNLAIEANDRGDYFPVWGTCLGFEQLAVLTSNTSVLVRTNTSGLPLPLNFTDEAKTSRIFKNFPAELMESLSREPLTVNVHKWSLSVDTLNKHDALKKFYRIISTNTDGMIEFVSTFEAYDYPIYGVQWHPEKNAFEWSKPYIPHTPTAIHVTFFSAEFFVSEARKNSHKFKTPEEERAALIYQHYPVYSGASSVFEQKYYF